MTIKTTLKEAEGSIQSGVGKAIGNKEMEVKGDVKKVAAKVEDAADKANKGKA